MYASLMRYRVKRGHMAEFARLTREGLYPQLRQPPGFVQHYIIHAEPADDAVAQGTSDQDGEEFGAVALYDRKEAAEPVRRVIRQWFGPTVGELVLEGGARVIAGEVVADTGVSSHPASPTPFQ